MNTFGYLIHFLLFCAIVSVGCGVVCALLSIPPMLLALMAYPRLCVEVWLAWAYFAGAIGMALFLIGSEMRGERMFP